MYHFFVSFVIKESKEWSMGARQNVSAIDAFVFKWNDTVGACKLKQFSGEEHSNIGEV